MTRTLADMTLSERQECVGMWCDNLASTAKTPSPVILSCVQGECCWILHTTLYGERSCFPLDAVAPRFDLPRAWTPDGNPAPSHVEWATVDRSTAPDNGWTGVRFSAGSEEHAKTRAHSFGYDVERRFVTDWEKA